MNRYKIIIPIAVLEFKPGRSTCSEDVNTDIELTISAEKLGLAKVKLQQVLQKLVEK